MMLYKLQCCALLSKEQAYKVTLLKCITDFLAMLLLIYGFSIGKEAIHGTEQQTEIHFLLIDALAAVSSFLLTILTCVSLISSCLVGFGICLLFGMIHCTLFLLTIFVFGVTYMTPPSHYIVSIFIAVSVIYAGFLCATNLILVMFYFTYRERLIRKQNCQGSSPKISISSSETNFSGVAITRI
ncbi:uncharacterized protein LOC108733325 [Agrilus planipennis]|uniref:Uncharacterized protein LOC108733325 n=1 Tax=Agrilus planipennis TaxID=224129 RepID=A0A1W4WHI1_AGRPL|nr:uncharacterized protein LOC108733325 [Agrilus planipennis]